MVVTETVVIDAEDTDVVALSAKVAHEIEGNLAIRRKKEVFDCKTLCDERLATVIVQLHAHTGGDFTSGFYGHGKKTILKQLEKSQDAMSLLADVGKQLPITTEVSSNLDKFTVQVVYNDQHSKNLAQCRANKWKQLKKKATQRLPPHGDTHDHHCERVNYISYIHSHYKRKEAPPSPHDHGWMLEQGKKLLSPLTELPITS